MQASIKKNFVYKSVLTISTYLMNFVTFPYVSRILGVDGIGLVSFVDNTVNYFLLFATMGISLIGVREIATVLNDRGKCNQIFSNILGLNLLFTIFTLVIYIFCILFIPQFNQYEELFYFGIAKIIFTIFLVEWFFTGLENFRYITVRSLLIKLLYVVAVFLGVRSQEDCKTYFFFNSSCCSCKRFCEYDLYTTFCEYPVSGYALIKVCKAKCYFRYIFHNDVYVFDF
ncbi:oligosaccharide flippase family protein [Bacteroides thetaiotaomicron]|uniref:oligosaccharide flippase family protein n=1 Tax=Bacteroides thetaiotaomicron TaxID=818 RepID=UPI0039C16204